MISELLDVRTCRVRTISPFQVFQDYLLLLRVFGHFEARETEMFQVSRLRFQSILERLTNRQR